MKSWLQFFIVAVLSTLLMACATTRPPSFDYTNFKQSKPRSILVLPPTSRSADVNANLSVLSLTTFPLAEAGYYVLPVALTYETFKQNGITVADEAQSVPFQKLHDIFGADCGLYITIDQYGSIYRVINSEVVVAASARLVDLRNGKTLWQGSARASSDENQQSGGGGLIGVLITAAINQVIHEVGDSSHKVADFAVNRLLGAGGRNGLLYGPYHPLSQSSAAAP